ncbi:helix-turn-helix transcriptional regulator [Pseudoflavitalea sp. X16]|uniref:helix-turn-helix transcriptional regulator n=1 Tax=Paraflavitalea devenefica TaxID=2716334 RepID=UPI00141D92F5|nr:helix-turn-helix transcriptional regulator [Paraflavitalea devenefica]NII25926.1 helix-turn-helix transcriptional regulator [Paraflavitalea devenefica]
MRYQEIKPATILKQYVKCYYVYESEASVAFDDTVFPSGCVEIIFNLGTGNWQTAVGDDFITTPPIELWGQIIKPLPIRSIGKNTMLGIRLFPHAAAYFLNDEVSQFNNQVVDFSSLSGKTVKQLYARLQETADWHTRIGLIEGFLLQQLSLSEGKLHKVAIVSYVMQEIRQDDFFDNIEHVASRYGITSRYMQKLFLQYTGLTPKLYSKINRFQNSLRLVTRKDASLTSIAYDCGYFDQSHFIREFKSFTGFTPSNYLVTHSPITSATANH